MQFPTFICWLSLLCVASALIKKCDYNSTDSKEANCPTNSICSANSYCVCEAGYVTDCSVKVIQLSDTLKPIEINHEFTYLRIIPLNGSFIMLSFEVCHESDSSEQEVVGLWYDDGTLPNLSSLYIHGSNQRSMNVKAGCTPLMHVGEFGVQPNGEREAVIFGIRMAKREAKMKLNIRVLQSQVFGFTVYLNIFIFILLTMLLLAICSICYCFHRIRIGRMRSVRRRATQKSNIQYITMAMPSYRFGEAKSQETCCICLAEFDANETIRRTICEHTFHTDCVDEWFMKQLNCPVCRTKLDKESIQGRKQQAELQMAIRHSLKEQEEIISGNINLREEMI